MSNSLLALTVSATTTPIGNSAAIWFTCKELVMRGACHLDGSTCRVLSRRLTAPARRLSVQAQAVASEQGQALPYRQPAIDLTPSDPTSVPRIPGIKDGVLPFCRQLPFFRFVLWGARCVSISSIYQHALVMLHSIAVYVVCTRCLCSSCVHQGTTELPARRCVKSVRDDDVYKRSLP